MRATILAAILALALIPLGAAQHGPSEPATAGMDRKAGLLVIGLDEIPADLKPGDRFEGGTVVEVERRAGFVVIEHPDHKRAGQEKAGKAGVRFAEADEPRFMLLASVTPNDPSWGSQYGPVKVRAPEAWALGLGGSSVSVCVVDTGVRYTHQDIAANWAGGYNFVAGTSNPWDDHGHGTHVAGIAAARIGNGLNVAGMANVPVYGVKVLDGGGAGTVADVASGILWCADNAGSRTVINLSLGGDYSSTITSAVNYAVAKGHLVVAAAGNNGGSILYPAALSNVVAVTCTTSTDNLCSFSSRGPEAEISAPGNSILSLGHGSNTGTATASGTSMSAPHVAGAAALHWNLHPDATATQVRERLQTTAYDLGTAGRDSLYGFGRLDMACLVQDALCRNPTSDLSATVILDPATVLVGETTWANVTVSNLGSFDTPGATLRATLGASLGVVRAELPDGCTLPSTALTCAIGMIPAGDSQVIPLRFVPVAAGSTALTFTVTGTHKDPVTANNAAKATLVVSTPAADLAASAAFDPPSLLAGQSAWVNVTVSNLGPQPSTGGALRASVAAGLGMVREELPDGCALPTTTLTCTLGPLEPGESAELSFHLIPTTPGRTSLTFRATGQLGDPVSGNNAASAPLTVLRPTADLWVQVEGPAEEPKVGHASNFTVLLGNDGPDDASATRLTASLPGQWTWDTSLLPPECVLVRLNLACAYGTLAAGETRSVELAGFAQKAGRGTLAARALTTALDATAGSSTSLAVPLARPVADLGVQWETPAEPLAVGVPSSYAFTLANAGPDLAPVAKLAGSLPSLVQWDLAGLPPECQVRSTTLTCDFGFLEPGGERRVELAGVPLRAGSATFGLRATTTGLDPVSGNNAASTPVAVPKAFADLGLEVGVAQAISTVGVPTTALVTFTNAGPDYAAAARFTGSLPGLFSWDATSLPAECRIASSTLVCEFGFLEPGGEREVQLTGTALRTGSASLTLRATTVSTDGTTANNAASQAFVAQA